MKHLLVGLVLCASTVNAQLYMKTGFGYASNSGLLSEVDFGYKLKQHQVSIGYVYTPYDFKSVYPLKYGHWFGKFNVHGGLGLVNKSDQYGNVTAYGTYILGAEYNTDEILQNANLYFGSDIIEKTVNVKAGIKIFYNKR